MTAPPWSRTAPPQPLPTVGDDPAGGSQVDGRRSEGHAEAEPGGPGATAMPLVAPAHPAGVTPSAPTEMFPPVERAGDGPAMPDSALGQPDLTTRQPRPVEGPTEAAPSAWSPGADPAPTTPVSGTYPEPGLPTPGPFVSPANAAPTYPPPVAPAPAPEQFSIQERYPGQQYHPGQDGYRPAYADEGSKVRGRGTLIGAVVAAGVAVVAVAGLGAVVLNRDDAPPPTTGTAPTTAAPTAAGPPPGDLKLRDDSVTITLTWTDPSEGAVPFMVAGGRAGQALGVMATVDPGRTSYTVNGLNSRVDYCFTVLAVYSTDSFATSGQVCTERERSTPPS
ncbi:fibronectin type III domain-containing protein [Micromonospora sp. BL4]|uniref:fibronectin type III domain-containing protein n=1 Tax=Micromonospora sp. BL4 TaxID=2478710 RepID=UPI001F46297C|nr:fibronectin type III domain-containing protein [Micromonospora sp. BL4]